MAQCLSPGVRIREYNSIKGERTQIYPCGKCSKCRQRKTSQWVFRLCKEAEVSSSVYFITLTYEDTPVSENMLQTLQKEDLQKFIKRLRHKNSRKIKYYAVGEYGPHTQRPHYHIVMFNLDSKYLDRPNLLAQIWDKGHIQIGQAKPGSMAYVSGYTQKEGIKVGEIEGDDRLPEFSLMSKKMGLNYLTPQMIQYYRNHRLTALKVEGGKFISMPRYYKEKIFSKRELNEIGEEIIEHMNLVENLTHDDIISQMRTDKRKLKFKKQIL